MNCNKIQPAAITPVLAAGSVASPFAYAVNLSQRLCNPTCADNTPIFDPKFSLVSVVLVSGTTYMATIKVEGTIFYTPCNGSQCCTKSQMLSQEFTIPVTSATAPTVTLTQGGTVNSVAASGCQSCSRNFVSETVITLTVATA